MIKHKIIHFLGICGGSMCALASILGKNNKVSGTDLRQMPVENCTVYSQDNEIHIPKNVDFIVYNTDIPHNNIEYKYAIDNNIKLIHRSELLETITNDRFKIAITGCSGKTSNTYYVHQFLTQINKHPFTLIGEITFKNNNNELKSYIEDCGPYVVELNEADMKYYQQSADILIFTNYGLDHIWLFENEQEFQDYYIKLFNNCKHVIYYDENNLIKNAKIVCKNTKFHSVSVEIIEFSTDWQLFAKTTKFKFENKIFTTTLYGNHAINNLITSMKAVQLFMELNYTNEKFELQTNIIENSKRRSQVLYRSSDLVIIDDQALYFKEMSTMIDAVKCFNKPISVVMDCYRDLRCNFFLEEYKKIAKSYRSASRFKQMEPQFILETNEDIANFIENSKGILILLHKFNDNLLNIVNNFIQKHNNI